MEYVHLIEFNHVKKEVTVSYIQWTENETILTWLCNIINRCFDKNVVRMDIDEKITSIIDHQTRQELRNSILYGNIDYYKFNGVCMLHIAKLKDCVDEMNNNEAATWLSNNVLNMGIWDFFEDYLSD